MKRLLALMLALVMVFALAACGKDGGETPDGGETTTKAPEIQALSKGQLTNKAGDYEYRIMGTELFDDENGEKALRLYIDFENKTADYTTTAHDVLAEEIVTQNGEELDMARAPYEVELKETEHYNSRVRPGHTIRFVREFKLTETTGTVNYKLVGRNATSNPVDILSYDIDLAKLAGAPKETLKVKTVADPQWNKGWPTTATFRDGMGEISNITSEFVDGDNGEKLIRVYFDVTNKNDDSLYINRLAEISAYQDGIELLESGAGNYIPEDGNYNSSVDAGATVRASVVYELTSTSTVEFEIYDIYGKGDTTGAAIQIPVK